MRLGGDGEQRRCSLVDKRSVDHDSRIHDDHNAHDHDNNDQRPTTGHPGPDRCP